MYSQFHAEYQPPQRDLQITHGGAHQSHGTDRINQPILFVSGQFAGQTIRAELREVQQADLGRKYARVDRRPLDPPPVIHLRLFEVYNTGMEQQSEKEVSNYEDVQVLGLLCTVDLFPIPPPANANHKHPLQTQRVQSAPPTQAVFPSSPGPSRFPIDHTQQSYTFVPSHTYPLNQSFETALSPSPTNATPPFIPGYVPQSPTSRAVHHVDGFPIMESSKMTSSLVGATFVQPAIVEFQGNKSIMFVFADLAVKVEGSFILRYRVFDIFSKPYSHSSDLAIQAECYGGAFRVYSTKEFPGLQASTELTKRSSCPDDSIHDSPQQLARWGVRLNTRETERKRRKKGDARSASPLYAGTGKRKTPLPSKC
ncbi:hypothetical protein D9615_003208 [Tricholomella constricta]|uniref:Velvet domain-containing protein n=1 Tax=Tricholomella constricta TaxID=117010 RepID=A0A8H5HIY8_9AGAR|nr:hypothetical protein D9615_003208 [Tricholomella constricta]